MELTFSQLEDSRTNEAFDLLTRVGKWLEQQGRQQRISNTTFETYKRWQSEEANFIVADGLDRIVGLVTMSREPLVEWSRFQDLGNVLMIRALATDPNHTGQGIGSFAISQLLSIAPQMSIFLDCVSDWLPDYYSRFGFRRIDRQVRSYPGAGTYNITLMRLDLADRPIDSVRP